MNLDEFSSKGSVEIFKLWKNGDSEYSNVPNTILLNGRKAMAKSLANSIGDGFSYYVTRMVFGDGGTQDGVKKYVNSNRNGLFGVSSIWKPVISTLDSTVPSQVIFTSSIRFDEGIGLTLNEMALQMHNGDFFSMTTFPDLNKTEDMQITFNWRISFI